MTERELGLLFLCGCTGAPLMFGFTFGYWLRGRVQRYGPLGALLPGWMRDRI